MPKKYHQPPTPPDLPSPSDGAKKRDYYNAGDPVSYAKETEWREGIIDLSDSSIILQTVMDVETSGLWDVPVERIRLRF